MAEEENEEEEEEEEDDDDDKEEEEQENVRVDRGEGERKTERGGDFGTELMAHADRTRRSARSNTNTKPFFRPVTSFPPPCSSFSVVQIHYLRRRGCHFVGAHSRHHYFFLIFFTKKREIHSGIRTKVTDEGKDNGRKKRLTTPGVPSLHLFFFSLWKMMMMVMMVMMVNIFLLMIAFFLPRHHHILRYP